MKPYEYGDKIRDTLLTQVRQLFMRRRLMTFDRINAPTLSKQITELYGQIDKLARYSFRLVYEYIWGQIINEEEEDEDMVGYDYRTPGVPFVGDGSEYMPDLYPTETVKTGGAKPKDRFDKLVNEFLSTPDPTVKFIWDTEMDRKRSRLFEEILVDSETGNRLAIEKAYETANKQIERQIKQFFIDIEDDAVIRAFEADDVQYVQWHTQQDARVCDFCDPLDEQIFRIDQVPTKHPNCRCWITRM